MSVDARTVKDLRDRTGAGMMDCKRALAETGGNVEAAIAYLREQGLASAAKKAGRVAAEGIVGAFVSDDRTRAVLVELNCETDFVAKNTAFTTLLGQVASALAGAGVPEQGTGEQVASLAVAGDNTLGGLIRDAVATLGENIAVRRFAQLSARGGRIGSYVHAGGKIGVLVELQGATAADDELAKAIAMQVAAAMPRYVHRGQVAQAEIQAEREIYRGQALGSGRPANVVDRIVEGKLEKFFHEICLLEQEYVRDPQLTVEKLVAQAGKSSGTKITVARFVRYQLGEGIERKESNLAAEVAAQIGRSS